MIKKFPQLPPTVPNDELRAQINKYFRDQLGPDPDAKRKRTAAADTIMKFPELIDRYIKLQEDNGDQAESVSSSKVGDTRKALVDQLRAVIADLEQRTDFYDKPWTSYDEALARAKYFKAYIEDNEGYKLLNRGAEAFSSETEVQIAFGLVWCNTDFDINREVNNGRGPVDYKASFGAGDKSLIEFKLASNTQLKRNLQNQVPIYEKANRTGKSVKVIIYFTEQQEARAKKILKELKLEDEKSILLIDARSDNKPSASKA
jgi:hypothetical protein